LLETVFIHLHVLTICLFRNTPKESILNIITESVLYVVGIDIVVNTQPTHLVAGYMLYL